MKYNPALAYRGLNYLIAMFPRSEERDEWIALLNLTGALCTLFRKQAVRCH